jgi:fructose-1,6-bisphosphatase
MKTIEQRKAALINSIETTLEYSEGELTTQIKNSTGEEQKELILKKNRLMIEAIDKIKMLQSLIHLN